MGGDGRGTIIAYGLLVGGNGYGEPDLWEWGNKFFSGIEPGVGVGEATKASGKGGICMPWGISEAGPIHGC